MGGEGEPASAGCGSDDEIKVLGFMLTRKPSAVPAEIT
jgi:hypothetical protein